MKIRFRSRLPIAVVLFLAAAAVLWPSTDPSTRASVIAPKVGPSRERAAEAKRRTDKAWLARTPAGAAILDEDADVASDFPDLARRTLNWRNARGEIEFGALVGPYSNAEASPVERLVALAQKSVEVEIYEMDGPGFRRALRDALRRGITVRVIKEPDAVGESCDFWADTAPESANVAARASCLDAQSLRKEIVAAGGRFEKFNKNLCGQTPRAAPTIGPRGGVRKPKFGRCFLHGKAVVIDRRLALISTGNFNASSLCDREAEPRECNRDYTYVTRDAAAVASLAQIFDLDIKGRWHDPREILIANGAHSKLTVSPWSFAPIAAFLESARSRIQVQNQYIYPESGLGEILIRKAKAGVSVEIQVADICHYGRVDDGPRTRQMRLMYQELESAGAKVRMFAKGQTVGGRPGKLHAKTIVIDGERAWIGSVNGSTTALNMNREFGIFFSHPRRVAALSRFMRADLEHPETQSARDSFACRR